MEKSLEKKIISEVSTPFYVFDIDILKSDLEKLSNGEDIYSPEYLPNGTGVSVPLSKFIQSQKLIMDILIHLTKMIS